MAKRTKNPRPALERAAARRRHRGGSWNDRRWAAFVYREAHAEDDLPVSEAALVRRYADRLDPCGQNLAAVIERLGDALFERVRAGAVSVAEMGQNASDPEMLVAIDAALAVNARATVLSLCDRLAHRIEIALEYEEPASIFAALAGEAREAVFAEGDLNAYREAVALGLDLLARQRRATANERSDIVVCDLNETEVR